MAVKVGIIGGGVAGVTTALVLGNLGIDVTLFEKKRSLISGPPFCHLHAGGNLYREISNEQCITLLRQSLDFAKLYPFAIDKRPTIFATPVYDPNNPLDIVDRLNILVEEYKSIIQKDKTKAILGKSEDYYQLFGRDDLLKISKKSIIDNPKSNEEWLIPFAKNIDFSTIKFPVIVIQEYGINLFRLAANSGLALEAMKSVELLRGCEVSSVKSYKDKYILEFNGAKKGFLEVDYLVNAAGFRTGIIDDMLNIKTKRVVEFKAAYTTKWEDRCNIWPEVIFHGIRGTNRGMGQWTPYCNGYVQLHAMTKDITLFRDGLAKSTDESSYPKLPKKFLDIIDTGWDKSLKDIRTKRAIEYLSYFFPKFKDAKIGGKPLYGAQQILGEDITLRVAEVSFPKPKYARCEIIKVSSVNDMTKEIVKNISRYFNISTKDNLFDIDELKELNENEITKRACEVAKIVGYPTELGKRCNLLSNLS